MLLPRVTHTDCICMYVPFIQLNILLQQDTKPGLLKCTTAAPAYSHLNILVPSPDPYHTMSLNIGRAWQHHCFLPVVVRVKRKIYINIDIRLC